MVAEHELASSKGIGRQALVLCNDLDARHSGDGVILRSYDAHLSVTFISDVQRTQKLCCNVCLLQVDCYGL